MSPDADEDLPDLTAADVAHAAVKIQAAYKGFKARKVMKQDDEELPDLNDVQVQEATVKIQSAFKGFAVRKQRAEEEKAAIKIQRNFRGFVTRKHGFARTVEVAQAAIKIQKVYRGFQVIFNTYHPKSYLKVTVLSFNFHRYHSITTNKFIRFNSWSS